MVSFHKRILALFLFFAILAATVASAPAGYGNEPPRPSPIVTQMIRTMRNAQSALVRGYEPLPSRDYRQIPNLPTRAWAIANADGIMYVDSHTQPGRAPEHYAYSIIKPNTELGRDMGLRHGESGSVLWKLVDDRLVLVAIDTIRDNGHQWSLNDLSYYVRLVAR